MRTYTPHEKAYANFCAGHGVVHPFPLSDIVICGFICHYFNTNRPFSAVKTALAAIRNLARLLGHDAHVLTISLRIALLKRGYKRGCTARSPRKRRIPITVWALSKLADTLAPDEDTYFALSCVGVFGLFRGGELTYKGSGSSLLRRSQVTWFPDRAVIHLPQSKADIEREGVGVTLFPNHSKICAYSRLRAIWDNAPDKSPYAPLFQHKDGTAVTYSFMLSWIKKAMARIGISSDQVGLHSFRIGGDIIGHARNPRSCDQNPRPLEVPLLPALCTHIRRRTQTHDAVHGQRCGLEGPGVWRPGPGQGLHSISK